MGCKGDCGRIARRHFDDGEIELGKPGLKTGGFSDAAGEGGAGCIGLLENTLNFESNKKFRLDDEDPQVG